MSQHIVLASVVIDPKKNRFRIHRPTLRVLGDPSLLQLLVSPTEKMVAIRAVWQDSPENEPHRIVQRRLQNEYSYEIYSQQLILKIFDIADVPSQHVYRLTGAAWVEGSIAVFPLSTLERLNREE